MAQKVAFFAPEPGNFCATLCQRQNNARVCFKLDNARYRTQDTHAEENCARISFVGKHRQLRRDLPAAVAGLSLPQHR